MSQWPSIKANRLLASLMKIGWAVKFGYPDYVFAFHDNVEIGPKMLARVAKHTGLTLNDL